MIKTLIFADSKHPEYSTDLITAATLIAGEMKSRNYLVGFGLGKVSGSEYFDYCIDIASEDIKDYDILNQANCLEDLHGEYNFDCILFPATPTGRMLAPRLAMRLGVGLVADVTDIKNDGTAKLIRPAFDGKIFATIVNAGSPPLMASIRPGVFEYTSNNIKDTSYIEFIPSSISPTTLELLEQSELPPSQDIRDSHLIVSGGGGVKGYFEKLEPLAKALGGVVGVSRSIVDSGIAPRSIQVGHSGKIVTPDLYIALGIYGSLQHVEGIRDVEHIISVNTNKNAPICSLSDIVVEGDAELFIDMLYKRIQKSEEEKIS